jgi:hypothetical protein
MTASPNVGNYYVGKGIVKWKGVNDIAYRDLGNAPTFEFTVTIKKLDHFSARQGVKFKDLSVVQEKSATVKLVLDEMTPENLAMALMGSADSTGLIINIMDTDEVNGALRFIGTNSVGDKEQVDLPFVSFTPGAAIGFIIDGYGTLDLSGDVTADESGVFGTLHAEISAEIP